MFQIVVIFLLLKMQMFQCDNILFRDNKLYTGEKCITDDQVSGVCTPLSECGIETKILNRKNICNFNASNPIVCCKLTTPDIKRVSELACEIYFPLPVPTQSPESGTYIGFAGGWRAYLGEQPHMAAIGLSLTEDSIDWNCGGTLISFNFILTAAHCVSGNLPDIIRLGEIDLSLNEFQRNIGSIDMKINRIYIHPQYKKEKVYHDLALLKVEPMTSSSFSSLMPACLWPKNQIPVSEAFTMGFGTSSFGGPKTNVLYEGNVTLVDLRACKIIYKESSRFPHGLIDSQICAHDPKMVVDTCQGDSGGPLQFTVPAMNNRRAIPYLIGVTSFGRNCFGNTPGVYVRIYPYLDWIESIVWEKGVNNF